MAVSGYNPTAVRPIDSVKADPTDLAALEAKLCGDDSNEPALPTPDEIIAMFAQE